MDVRNKAFQTKNCLIGKNTGLRVRRLPFLSLFTVLQCTVHHQVCKEKRAWHVRPSFPLFTGPGDSWCSGMTPRIGAPPLLYNRNGLEMLAFFLLETSLFLSFSLLLVSPALISEKSMNVQQWNTRLLLSIMVEIIQFIILKCSFYRLYHDAPPCQYFPCVPR